MRRLPEKETPRVNLRPVLFCALSVVMGILILFRASFGEFRPADLFFFLLFFGFAVFPLSLRRTAILLAVLLLFGGLGALSAYSALSRFQRGEEEGRYAVTGTVISFAVKEGYCEAELTDLFFDGEKTGGRLSLTLPSEEVRAGDVLSFEGNVHRNGVEDTYSFIGDIRYRASVEYFRKIAEKNAFLRLRSRLYDVLHSDMGEEGDVLYSLLTGDTKSMDAGFSEAARRGGIAHIFAVSGLHIGIVYGAVLLLARPLKRYAFAPALCVAALYTAFCGFTVSSVRAVLMCGAAGITRAFGKKYDFLESVSAAAFVILLLAPKQLLSAGFQLSFGACCGLALFSGPLSRLFRKIRLPRAISGLLAADLAVQLFTFPILLGAFGYYPVWGILLNLVLIPALTPVFLSALLSSALALIFPHASFLLAVPRGAADLLLLAFSADAPAAALCGFSLGAGGAVFLTGAVFLSGRVRFSPVARAGCAALFAALFGACLVYENVALRGVRIYADCTGSGNAVFIEEGNTAVLVIDDDVGLAEIQEFLGKRYGGTLDAVIVLGEDEAAAINRAAFLDAKVIVARDEVHTGLRETPLAFGEEVRAGDLYFRYERRDKLFLIAENAAVEMDFSGVEVRNGDLCLGAGCGRLKFSIFGGIIKQL